MNFNLILGIFILIIVIFTAGCTSQNYNHTGDNQTNQTPGSFKLNSSAFTQGGIIPQKYTAHGEDISPPLSWNSAPADTQSFTIICEDPDAPGGSFIHWIVFDIPWNVTSLSEGITNEKTLVNGAKQGTNSFNKIGYSGPSPPSGSTHKYPFKIYALDTTLNLDTGATIEQVNNAMKNHILSQTKLTGKYTG